MRRFFIKLDETSGLGVSVVSNCLALVKLKDSGGINLTKLALRWPELSFEGNRWWLC
jgi:hypothetical protein